MSELKAKDLKARLDALRRGDQPPQLAGEILADAYEHDDSVGPEGQLPGVVTMKSVAIVADEIQLAVSVPSVVSTVGVEEELIDGETALTDHVEIEITELDQEPILNTDETPTVVMENAIEDEVIPENGQTENAEIEDDLPINEEQNPPVKPVRAKIVIAGLIVIGGLAVYSAFGLSSSPEKEFVGTSSVVIDPPAIAPSLSPVQAPISSANMIVQTSMSSAAVLPLKSKAYAKPLASPAINDETKSHPVQVKTSRASGKLGAVLPLKFRQSQQGKPVRAVALKTEESSRPVPPTKLVESDSLIDMLERAKGLN